MGALKLTVIGVWQQLLYEGKFDSFEGGVGVDRVTFKLLNNYMEIERLEGLQSGSHADSHLTYFRLYNQ